MAVAGFGEGEHDGTAKENSLVITGSKAKPEEGPQEDPQEHRVKYLHRGIATRAFERRFDLADHIKVTGAKLENGLLRSEESRVGKEWVRTCRFRWSPCH